MQRTLGWLSEWLKVLPSDPRIWAMSPEQLDQLYRQFAHIHPNLVKGAQSVHFEDPEFEEYVERAGTDTGDVLYPGTRVVEFGSEAVEVAPAGEPSLSPHDPDDWEDLA
jgi:hypothetical protein